MLQKPDAVMPHLDIPSAATPALCKPLQDHSHAVSELMCCAILTEAVALCCSCLPCRWCSGFYVDKDIQNWGGTGHPRICLVVQAARQQAGEVQKFRIRRPNNGWLRLEIAHAEVRQQRANLAVVCPYVHHLISWLISIKVDHHLQRQCQHPATVSVFVNIKVGLNGVCPGTRFSCNSV